MRSAALAVTRHHSMNSSIRRLAGQRGLGIPSDDDDEDEEDPEESEFKFSKKEAMEVDYLEMALPLGGYLHKFQTAMAQEVEESKIQTDITLFFTRHSVFTAVWECVTTASGGKAYHCRVCNELCATGRSTMSSTWAPETFDFDESERHLNGALISAQLPPPPTRDEEDAEDGETFDLRRPPLDPLGFWGGRRLRTARQYCRFEMGRGWNPFGWTPRILTIISLSAPPYRILLQR
ncbi:hypothetical protein B0H13DRAFT_1854733 [Mycena leptocephala]|nr:hypothetical protein B0H13DRAFT_1854733 [Mycena leptocephala]